MLPKNVLYYGKEQPLPTQTALRAGPLSVVFEEGDIRYVKYGDREILRRVYVALRDRNWGTVAPQLSNIQMQVSADSFTISYDVECKQGEIDFIWKGTLVGDAQGTITFTMDGLARSTFWRGRIGFCILHPILECAGQPCLIEKADGTVQKGQFPLHVSPHQPFLDVRAMTHEVVPGLQAEVRFAGDVFETEDHRNWTDASYKTYCTPLAIPFPVEVKKGTRITQSVTLTLKGTAPATGARPAQESLTFTVGQAPTGPLPQIGLGMASHGRPLTPRELARLKVLNLSHVRADLSLSRAGWEDEMARAVADASGLGVSLEAALILSDAGVDELKALGAALDRVASRGARPGISRWLVFHEKEKSTSEKWIRLAREQLSRHAPAAQFASGTNHFFAELNRGRPPTAVLDLVTYSINPQLHAFDNASLAENLAGQAYTVESARQFSGGLPIIISPVTFRMRINPNASAPEPPPAPGTMPWRVDVRQMSLFGAGWTAGSLKYLGESGVYSATYFETSGWLGVMETEAGPPVPDAFRSLPGAVFPMYHVFADAGEFAGGQVIPTTSSDALRVDGLAMRKDGKTRLLLANLSDRNQKVSVKNVAQRVRVRRLDETNAEQAMRSPESFRAEAGELSETREGILELTLAPYAIAQIDSA